jgi:parvulin-like peptidyl-prolyl isomerase
MSLIVTLVLIVLAAFIIFAIGAFVGQQWHDDNDGVNIVNQSGNIAGGDIVGGDKIE